ncbi:MAG: hypothetical protein RJB01_1759 [Actinomycetota bacterium]
MKFPTVEQYLHALQAPDVTVLDPVLARGTVELSPIGVPLARMGGFSLTFKVISDERTYALRCLLKDRPTFAERMMGLNNQFGAEFPTPLAPFTWLEQGLGLNGRDFPAIRMDWVSGDPLGIHLEKTHRDVEELIRLRRELRACAHALHEVGIAHGDLHTFNIHVQSDGALRLIDYDAYFSTSIAHLGPLEAGHGNFQHPMRAELRLFGPNLDSFSFIALDTALACLQEDPSLWEYTASGAEALLFRADDFADPQSSRVFERVRALPGTAQQVRSLMQLAQSDPRDLPLPLDLLPELAH